jgi:hypothetical protein
MELLNSTMSQFGRKLAEDQLKSPVSQICEDHNLHLLIHSSSLLGPSITDSVCTRILMIQSLRNSRRSHLACCWACYISVSHHRHHSLTQFRNWHISGGAFIRLHHFMESTYSLSFTAAGLDYLACLALSSEASMWNCICFEGRECTSKCVVTSLRSRRSRISLRRWTLRWR